jgi:serine/threonine protein kinase
VGPAVGHYRIVRLLGSGGMGQVYHAFDTELRRDVALKLLPESQVSDPARRLRFEREVRAIATLNHPPVVTLYAAGESDGRLFLTLEYVDGETLSSNEAIQKAAACRAGFPKRRSRIGRSVWPTG